MRFPKLAAATQHLQSKPEPDAMKLRHVVESQQFTVPLLMELFDRSRGMERVVARGGSLDYQNRIMATVFYAPSTRTRFSFEAAMHRLGGRVRISAHSDGTSQTSPAAALQSASAVHGLTAA